MSGCRIEDRQRSEHLLSAPIFHIPFFSHDRPVRVNILLTNFFLKLSFTPTSTLSSPILLLTARLTHTILLTRLFLVTWIFCCFSVSAFVSRAFLYAGVTHERSTFPLDLPDMRLSPITPSTFLQVISPAVILIITKGNYLANFALGN